MKALAVALNYRQDPIWFYGLFVRSRYLLFGCIRSGSHDLHPLCGNRKSHMVASQYTYVRVVVDEDDDDGDHFLFASLMVTVRGWRSRQWHVRIWVWFRVKGQLCNFFYQLITWFFLFRFWYNGVSDLNALRIHYNPIFSFVLWRNNNK